MRHAVPVARGKAPLSLDLLPHQLWIREIFRYISSNAVQYHFLCGELQNEVRSRLTSACGIHRLTASSLSVTCGDRVARIFRCCSPDRTRLDALFATPEIGLPRGNPRGVPPLNGERLALRIRSISASSMP